MFRLKTSVGADVSLPPHFPELNTTSLLFGDRSLSAARARRNGAIQRCLKLLSSGDLGSLADEGVRPHLCSSNRAAEQFLESRGSVASALLSRCREKP